MMQDRPVDAPGGRSGNPRAEVCGVFDKLGIDYKLIEHPACFTADDRDDEMIADAEGGVILKNLFLRNKNKSRYLLYTLPIDKKGDLAALASVLEESRLSFANEDILWEKLRILPGSVSLLNTIGSVHEGVEFLVDADVFELSKIGLHPNDNTATILFAPGDIDKLMTGLGISYRRIEL